MHLDPGLLVGSQMAIVARGTYYWLRQIGAPAAAFPGSQGSAHNCSFMLWSNLCRIIALRYNGEAIEDGLEISVSPECSSLGGLDWDDDTTPVLNQVRWLPQFISELSSKCWLIPFKP